MTIFDLIGERAPVVRTSDRLTEDHPLRPYPAVLGLRASAWLRALAFAAVFIVAAILCVSVHTAVTTRFTVTTLVSALAELISAVVAYLVLALVLEARTQPLEIAPRRLAGLLKGLVLGLVLVGVCLGLLAVFGVYRVTAVDSSYRPWQDLLVIGLTAGVAEEILMRGVLFRLVEEGLGSWGAVAVSALVFGLSHLNNPDASLWGAVAIAIEAGILFAAIYVVTRSLWWCIGVHIAWNMAEGPVFGSTVSGLGDQASWFQAGWSGPELLTGGSFGLEGSIVPVIVLGALGVVLLVQAQRRGLMLAPIWIRKAALTSAEAT